MLYFVQRAMAASCHSFTPICRCGRPGRCDARGTTAHACRNLAALALAFPRLLRSVHQRAEPALLHEASRRCSSTTPNYTLRKKYLMMRPSKPSKTMSMYRDSSGRLHVYLVWKKKKSTHRHRGAVTGRRHGCCSGRHRKIP